MMPNENAAIAAQNVSTSQGEPMETQEGATTMVAKGNNRNNLNHQKMNTLSLPLLKRVEEKKVREEEISIPNMVYDNQAALDEFEVLQYNAIKFEVRFRTKAGERVAVIHFQLPNGSRQIIVLKVNQPILEYLYKVCHAEFPEKPKLTGEEDYRAEAGEDFGFEVFRMEAEAGRRFNSKEDYVNSQTGEHYLQTVSYHIRGAIHYCIKRTSEVQQFLEEKGFILKRSF